MVMLDATVVNVALPGIREGLGFTAANLSWVLTAYTLTFGGLLLLGARAGDLFGRRRTLLFGVVLFTLASFAGGLAPSAGVLIAARAIQGVG
ncbi:MAG: MFS transporter, partial [Candidatus Dormiibacterota bacterium]